MTAFRKRRVWTWATIFLALVALVLGAAFYVGYLSSDPVKVLPASVREGKAKAVFLSGDLGFNMGMGPKIVGRLVDAGIPVVGFNSLTYFRSERTPAEVTGMVKGLMDRADREFGAGPTIMVGQSFGADALQLALADLSPDERKRIALVVLVVPTDSVYLRASPNEMFNFTPADLPGIDSARTIDWVPLLCIHGQAEEHSLCPLLKNPNVRSVALPGGHYLDHDVSSVMKVILPAVERAARS